MVLLSITSYRLLPVLSWMSMVWRPYGPRFTPVINTHYTCVHFTGRKPAQNTLNCFANLLSYCFVGTLTRCPLSLLLAISIIHLLIGFLFLVTIPLTVIFLTLSTIFTYISLSRLLRVLVLLPHHYLTWFSAPFRLVLLMLLLVVSFRITV